MNLNQAILLYENDSAKKNSDVRISNPPKVKIVRNDSYSYEEEQRIKLKKFYRVINTIRFVCFIGMLFCIALIIFSVSDLIEAVQKFIEDLF